MIYLNNAATTYPKFNEVNQAVASALSNGFMFCNRDSVEYTKVAETIFKLRQCLSNMFHAQKPHDICLLTNDTLALNMLIFGQNFKKGDVVITSPFEHNSVSRPLCKTKATIEFVNINKGIVDINHLKKLVKNPKVKCCILSHASNVTGDVINAKEVGSVLHENKTPFILDVAQSAGYVDIDVEKWNVSALTFSGHKGLGGPQGTGGFYIRKGFDIKPILFGGTGNHSSEVNNPIVFPDSFEVGTPAVHDLIGLYASLLKIQKNENYKTDILSLTQYLHDNLKQIPNVVCYFGQNQKKTPVVSFNIKGLKAKQVGEMLAQKNIVCRTGYHCSAWGIEKIKAEAYGGTVRLSCGYFNTRQEIDYTLKTIKETCENLTQKNKI